MKFHYINISLFALPLNILVYNQRNHNITTLHTQTNRLLCECELYAPANYDNEPQMKEVMENFNRQTSQRFHEYNERMKTTRQKCKDKCDKEIQNIILKDKLEKRLMEKFATLQTDIQNDAIPTCICEKSIEDKVEKGCLRCGGILGAAAPELGSIGGTVVYAAAQSASMKTFISLTVEGLKEIGGMTRLFGDNISQFVTPAVFGKPMNLVIPLQEAIKKACAGPKMNSYLLCNSFETRFAQYLPSRIEAAVEYSVHFANEKWAEATTPNVFLNNPIILSAIAILIIILIMVIIYLILRYRRKKKMKKKLQYIKLLEE
ncbi:rifin PIR protein, putative [Plasmodium reichenowi]|uniref:Rifin PIR protein, putative n=1 Tax=Plasmodium reichenowi TaxID=5854 RepID=A0A2P9DTI7_PLARE|nr:rifin PIR protein, putative [Plasmodium reichenowi]